MEKCTVVLQCSRYSLSNPLSYVQLIEVNMIAYRQNYNKFFLKRADNMHGFLRIWNWKLHSLAVKGKKMNKS